MERCNKQHQGKLEEFRVCFTSMNARVQPVINKATDQSKELRTMVSNCLKLNAG